MKKPLISIVTVVYNGAQLLETTLQSAWEQTWPEKEFIVVDGGSTDGTLEIIQQHQTRITRWISEPDKGIYDAMNKGIGLSRGDFIYFLNVGDAFLHPKVLQNIFDRPGLEHIDFIYAKVQTANDPTGITRIIGRPVTLSTFYFDIPVCHQATFTRKRAFDQLGTYDTQYKITADQEWFIRQFKSHPKRTLFIDELVALYEIVGASFNRRFLTLKEELLYSYRHFPLWVKVANTIRYPLLWLKVALIKRFLHHPLYHWYRQQRFGKQH